jgi:methionyl-tRNA synthetase
MLMAHGEFILPDYVAGNEFLNYEGAKFSKSKGHGSTVKDIAELFNPDSLRYAIASSLPENKDSDFTFKDLQAKNNNELGAILGNFVNRTFVFAEKYFEGKVPARNKLEDIDNGMLKSLKEGIVKVSEDYENFRFRDAVMDSMNIVRDANKYFNDTEPWKAIKQDKQRCETIINICLHLVYAFGIIFNPILPFSSTKIMQSLNLDDAHINWDNITDHRMSDGHVLNKSVILFTKIEDEQLS